MILDEYLCQFATVLELRTVDNHRLLQMHRVSVYSFCFGFVDSEVTFGSHIVAITDTIGHFTLGGLKGLTETFGDPWQSVPSRYPINFFDRLSAPGQTVRGRSASLNLCTCGSCPHCACGGRGGACAWR